MATEPTTTERDPCNHGMTLAELMLDELSKDNALLAWIAGLSDANLAVAYRKARLEYADLCDYEQGESLPCEPRKLPLMIEALLQRCEG